MRLWKTGLPVDKKQAVNVQRDTALALAVHDRGEGMALTNSGELRIAIERALRELGVPGPNYPVPVLNAIKILQGAIGETVLVVFPTLPCGHVKLEGGCADCNTAFDASIANPEPLGEIWREMMTHESAADVLADIAAILEEHGWPVP